MHGLTSCSELRELGAARWVSNPLLDQRALAIILFRSPSGRSLDLALALAMLIIALAVIRSRLITKALNDHVVAPAELMNLKM
jgi:hypothetical protein